MQCGTPCIPQFTILCLTDKLPFPVSESTSAFASPSVCADISVVSSTTPLNSEVYMDHSPSVGISTMVWQWESLSAELLSTRLAKDSADLCSKPGISFLYDLCVLFFIFVYFVF